MGAGIWLVNIGGRPGTGCPGRVGGCDGWKGCAGRTATGGAEFGTTGTGNTATGSAGAGCDRASCIRSIVGGSGFVVCPETFKTAIMLMNIKDSNVRMFLFFI